MPSAKLSVEGQVTSGECVTGKKTLIGCGLLVTVATYWTERQRLLIMRSLDWLMSCYRSHDSGKTHDWPQILFSTVQGILEFMILQSASSTTV